MARGEEILDGRVGREEKRKEALSLFDFHLSTFPQETPDTQASFGSDFVYAKFLRPML